MRFYPSCCSCMIRQTVNAVELFSGDETLAEDICRQVLAYMDEMDGRVAPPVVAQFVYRLIRETFACDDPYKRLKAEANRMARCLLPALRRGVSEARNPLEMALRYAVAGNCFDFSVSHSTSRAKILTSLEAVTKNAIVGLEVPEFQRNVEFADKILYLADNAGEIFFDRLLIERLAQIAPVTVAVKGGPVANKATREDAEMAGLEEISRVIDTGVDIPGTVVSQCSQEFQACFHDADVVLAKGQAHYETLNPSGREIFHLFMVKCETVAQLIAQPMGSMVFLRMAPQAVRAHGASAGQAGKKIFELS